MRFILLILLPLTISAQVDWSSEMPPAMNQGNTSECVSYACSYLMARNICKAEGITPESMSPSFIHNQVTATTGGNGLTYGEALDFLMQNGICRLTELPSGMPDISLRYQSLKYRIDGWYEFYSIDTAIAELMNGPILTLIQNPSGSLHAVCVVGYADSCFKYLNSEGPGWGFDGYGYISFEESSLCFWAVEDDLVYTMPAEAYLVNWNLPGNQPSMCATYTVNNDTVKPVLNSYWVLTDSVEQLQIRNQFKAISTDTLNMDWVVYDVSKWNNGLCWLIYDTTTTRSIRDTLFLPWWEMYVCEYTLTVNIYDIPTSVEERAMPNGVEYIDLLGRKTKSRYYIKNRKLYYK